WACQTRPAIPAAGGDPDSRLALLRRGPAGPLGRPRYHRGAKASDPRGQRNRVSVLEEILDGVRADLAARPEHMPLERLKETARKASSPRDPVSMLKGQDVAVIAEVKRASPSKGTMAKISDPAALARDYEAGGASIISVLTEPRYFGGSLDDLAAVR